MKTTENSSQTIDIEQFEINRKKHDAFRSTRRYRLFNWVYRQPVKLLFNTIQRGLRLADGVCEYVKNWLLSR